MRSPLLDTRTGVAHGFELPGTVPPVPFWRPRQVHGPTVLAVRSPSSPAIPGDGAVASSGDCAAAVVTADCVPVLLAADGGRVVAALHAGWRGLAEGVLEEGLAVLAALAPAAPVWAALGPAAGGCCYEVGPEVLAALVPASTRITPTRDSHARLDLRGAVLDRLLALGLQAAAIDLIGPCTICTPPWPSYRREGTRAGRILSWIAPRPA